MYIAKADAHNKMTTALTAKLLGWHQLDLIHPTCDYDYHNGHRCAVGWCMDEPQNYSSAIQDYILDGNVKTDDEQFLVDAQILHDQLAYEVFEAIKTIVEADAEFGEFLKTSDPHCGSLS